MVRILAGVSVLLAFLVAAAGCISLDRLQSATSTLPVPQIVGLAASPQMFTGPPTSLQCLKRAHRNCYSPQQLQTAYDMQPLFSAGLNGRKVTIAIVDSFGSPTVRKDLKRFDRDFSLPAPPSFKIISPAGPISPFNPRRQDRSGWALETTMDVEYVHAMAPGAKIVLVETPVDETIGVQGFPQMVESENYVINHHLAAVISQSFGAAEQTFPNFGSIRKLRSAFFNARRHHVTVVAATGDSGPTSPSTPTSSRFFTKPVAMWPATDPLVTSVGGTSLHLTTSGQRRSPDTVWNDCPGGFCLAAGGGGLSVVFGRPQFQSRVRSVVKNWRGMPDISMSADPHAGALVYASFPGIGAGYHVVGGTSLSAPLFAGIVAVADQANGSSLGFLNGRLYRLGSGSRGLPDITSGETTVRFRQSGRLVTVRGFKAVPGYDLATGLGTVDGALLVKALIGKRI